LLRNPKKQRPDRQKYEQGRLAEASEEGLGSKRAVVPMMMMMMMMMMIIQRAVFGLVIAKYESVLFGMFGSCLCVSSACRHVRMLYDKKVGMLE
jgi:hypothetical protein